MRYDFSIFVPGIIFFIFYLYDPLEKDNRKTSRKGLTEYERVTDDLSTENYYQRLGTHGCASCLPYKQAGQRGYVSHLLYDFMPAF